MATRKKNLVKSVFQEGSRRAKGEAVRQKDLVKTTLRSRFESAIPSNLRWILPFVEGFRGQPEVEDTLETGIAAPVETLEAGTIVQAPATPVAAPVYEQYRCLNGNPLNCGYAQATVQQDAKAQYCLECGFPATLAEQAEIRGSRGRYRIDRWIRQRGMGRLYQGVQVPDEQPVVIKEYLLPSRNFGPLEMRQRQQVFTQLAGIRSIDGRIQDFRVLAPWEAIADHNQERCYLVTKGTLDTQPTLQDYLTQYGAMTAIQVRHVLDQVLQTLDFLHRQKLQLPGGQIVNDPRAQATGTRAQVFAHGNLSLDSLLIVGSQDFWQQAQAARAPKVETLPLENGKKAPSFLDSILLSTTNPTLSPPAPISPLQIRNSNISFFIHVCDLALWESLFNPQSSTLPAPLPQQDLVALGHIAFYLLVGQTHDRAGKPLEPQNEQDWVLTSPSLKSFILRLIGIELPFESAEAARQFLLRLPPEPQVVKGIELMDSEAAEPIAKSRLHWWLLGALGLLLLASLIGWLIARPKSTAVAANNDLLPCCIQKVPAVPDGSFTYTAEQQGTWNYVLRQKNLIRPDQTLEQELRDRKPKFALNFQPIRVPALGDEGDDAVLKAVQAGEIQPPKAALPIEVDFGITSRLHNLSSDLEATTIAYDGLTVFVSFSYAKRKQGLPNALQGIITFDQLRRLYTGQIAHWSELDSRLPDLPVKLYIPTEAEAVRIFEERVLKDQSAIAKFRSLISQPTPGSSFIHAQGTPIIYQNSTSQMLIKVIQDFENQNIGAIGFSTLSKVIGYCSVYPLALDAGDRQAIQPLVQDSGQAIDPNTDLCDDKGSYHADIQSFKTGRYPLAYPLAVIYPRDNSRPAAGEKFAEMLRTKEGQTLLQKTGLVPLIRP